MTNNMPAVKGRLLKGIFFDSPVQGLEYETRTTSGITDAKGGFKYHKGETVTFSIGGLVLGTAEGKAMVTPADLVIEFGGDMRKLKLKKVTNIAKFIQSLGGDGYLDNGIHITEETRKIIHKYRNVINFDQKEDTFEADPNVKALFAELKINLRTSSQTRNQLRRSLMGIKRLTNVKIPMRDGIILVADIYLPVKEGKYPAIVALGGHGKVLLGAMGLNYSNKKEDVLNFEDREDKYFEGNQDRLPAVESHGTANSVDWVPHGYALVRIDERGVGDSTGTFEQFSLQEAKDFYDSIEWTAQQPWCDGKVGTWGFSYWAMSQWGMAQLQPPSLKAIMPVFGSIDSYRDYTYNGGLFNHTVHVCELGGRENEWRYVDWPAITHANPFDDPQIYGPEGSAVISPDMNKVTMPLWSVMPLEYFSINIRGSSEGYIHAASKNKKLTIAGDSWSAYPYCPEFFKESRDFFDYWLKGIDNGVMDKPPVKVMIRTGGGGYFWQVENEWPIARTQYTRYFLNASPSSWKGDGLRNDFLKISPDVPRKETAKTYSAEVNLKVDPGWSHGISFITEPMTEDVILAGYIKLGLWVASSSSDMDIVADIRIMDDDGSEVPYSMTFGYAGIHHPVTIGWLKVSHRKTDPAKSTVYRPWHTHLKSDYQPLKPGEVVPVEVEIWPTTLLIQKGRRLRLDIQPTDGWDHPCLHDYDETYHKGATNTIYTGPDYPSYIQLPEVPLKK